MKKYLLKNLLSYLSNYVDGIIQRYLHLLIYIFVDSTASYFVKDSQEKNFHTNLQFKLKVLTFQIWYPPDPYKHHTKKINTMTNTWPLCDFATSKKCDQILAKFKSTNTFKLGYSLWQNIWFFKKVAMI